MLLEGDEHFTTISSGEIANDLIFQMSIEVPLELAYKFSQQGTVTVVSYLYYNVEALFPDGLPGEENL